MQESDIRYRINQILENKSWVLDSSKPERNVYFESSLPPKFKKKLKGKRPDYTMFLDGVPVGVIEAKKPGVSLEKALDQGEQYGKMLGAKLIFAVNGAFCKTRFTGNGKQLILNGSQVKELPSVSDVSHFVTINDNEIYTIPQQIIESREELIKVFAEANDSLRVAGLRAGIERFSEFANILFLKLLSEANRNTNWDDIKKQKPKYRIKFINNTIFQQLRKQYGGGVFKKLSFKNHKVLSHIIDKLDPLSLTHVNVDVKGSAFEYFIEKSTSTHNDLGEYFTPRHIIQSVVHLAAPRAGEKIYDPFCGTGGFLTEAFRHVTETTRLTDSQRESLMISDILGVEVTTTAQIAKMNMILYGDGHSGILERNSLEHPIDGEYDLVLTNIPFSQCVDSDTSSLYYSGITKENGNATCLAHCLKSVKKEVEWQPLSLKTCCSPKI